MPPIRILPEVISNKIAAGEVVERPASVVKELVENALDAGSSKIVIEIEKGGRRLIRVSDNGSGMSRDDALLSLERYATSKIASDADLFAIRSLGFRGEALPSIAAVSRFTLVTREREADAGTEIRVAGGKIEQVADTGAPPGTLVSVENIFYNTPARRKFLKTVATEMGHIADVVASIALGRPEVSFRLVHDAKTVKSWPAAVEQLDRVADVLGTGLQNDLFPVARQAEETAVNGWVAAPRVFRSTSRGVFIYVNGRFVRDRVVQHALFAGYRQRLTKGRFPVAALFLSVPYDAVDVNVHPTKHEVRFARQRQVHDLVQAAVSETLDRQDRPHWRGVDYTAAGRIEKGIGIAESNWHGFNKAQGSKLKAVEKAQSSKFKVEEAQSSKLKAQSILVGSERAADQPALWQPAAFGDLRVIGQLHNTYIVCESEGGMLLLDQHAAHERILYEQLSLRSETLKKQAQRLLVPETIELGFREAGIIEQLLPEFDAFGLEIEPFGTNTFLARAVPGLLAGREIAPLVREIAEKLAAGGHGSGADQAIDESLKLMACHGAIRARQTLDTQQIRELLRQLDQCRNPSHCPHGRPTWLKWTARELEKSFNRIV